MKPETIAHAARQLAEARVTRLPLAELDAHAAPQSAADVHAIQDATVSLLGEQVAGWKVTTSPAGEFVRGAILGSRVFASPASIDGALVPMRAVELEIAFRFERAL
ncbi:MAG: hydratase, partial [Paraburkholderia graminis]